MRITLIQAFIPFSLSIFHLFSIFRPIEVTFLLMALQPTTIGNQSITIHSFPVKSEYHVVPTIAAHRV